MKPDKENRKSFMLPALGAGLFLLLGVAMLIWPEQIVGVFPPLLGVVLLLVGIQGVAYNLVMGKRAAASEMGLLRGVINLVVGVVFLFKQDLSMAFMSVLFGLYVLVSSAANLVAALGRWREKKPFATDLADSVFGMVIGLLLLFSPFTGRALWVRVLGVYFVISAANALRGLYGLQKDAQAADKTAEDDTEDS